MNSAELIDLIDKLCKGLQLAKDHPIKELDFDGNTVTLTMFDEFPSDVFQNFCDIDWVNADHDHRVWFYFLD